MQSEYNPEDKVKYHTGDNKWKNGVIHGVRKVDDINGAPRVLSYIIDTGHNKHVQVHKFSPKNAAASKHYNKHLARGLSHGAAAEKAAEAVLKMPDDVIETVERQPEQVDVRPENVKLR